MPFRAGSGASCDARVRANGRRRNARQAALRDLRCGDRPGGGGLRAGQGHGRAPAMARRILRVPGRGHGRARRQGGRGYRRCGDRRARALSEAVVVGAGPNGLACAVALAREGLAVTVLEAEETIGGGTRSGELTVPGVLHDLCSAVHPMAVGSPFLRSLDLDLEWCWPDVDCAHPLDDGSAGTMHQSVEETARALGDDGRTWRRLFERPARSLERLTEDIF